MQQSLKEFSQPSEYTIVTLPLFFSLQITALNKNIFTKGVHLVHAYQIKTQGRGKC